LAIEEVVIKANLQPLGIYVLLASQNWQNDYVFSHVELRRYL